MLQLEGNYSRLILVSLTRNSEILFVSKAETLVWIDVCLVEKLKSVMATKCFHVATSSSKER